MVKKTLCLNMIVKDESHIIEETLTNITEQMKLDYWVISDTGSTDNTQQIIKDFFKNKNIPGELFEDEWKDFGHNRSVALAHAYNKTDYLFIFDADDKIMGNLVIDKEKINIERYDLTLGNEFTYVRPLLITNRKRWKYEGVLHEYLTPLEPIVSTEILPGDYYIESRRLGARSSFQDKYEKDAAILSNAFEEEKKEGLKNRYAFYAAQSYKDCNQTDKAIEWYLKVLNLNNWNQEKYHSCLMMGVLFLKKNDFENALKFLTLSHKYDHERLEGIVLAMELCFKKDMHSLVHTFYQTYKNAKVDLVQKLFVTTTYYNQHMDFYNSISAFYINEYESGYQSIKNVIHSEKIEESKKLLTLNNMRFYQPILLNDKNLTIDFFYKVNDIIIKRGEKHTLNNEEIKHWNIIFQNVRKNLTKYQLYKFKNKKQPKIFLSFTTCKRLDLFGQTINSILNHWLDKDKIDYWFCVDDNSSEEDRNYMKRLYPWIDYYMKDEEEKGHKQSMNIIFNKLKELQPTYWIHMEDDFLFFEQNHYIKQALQGLEQLKEHNVKQILFNREYGEVISDYNIISHKQISEQSAYCLHDYDANKKSSQPNCYYWPVYSFRPSLIDVKTILELGDFETEETFFERTYALKWVKSGYQSAFFNKLTHIHIGRLTSERMNKDKKNAYELNETNQFFNQETVKNMLIINLKHRKDRKEIMTKKLESLSLTNKSYQFVEAINGYELEPSQELYNIFKGLDVGYKKGVIGCALTHIRLWEQLLKDPNNDYYLILEDDCIFRQDFKKQIENLQEEMKKQECLFLGYHMFSQKREEYKQLYNNDNDQLEIKELDKDLYIGGYFCYSINKVGALKLIQYIKENGVNHGIDYLNKIIVELKSYEIQPQIVFSDWNENGKEIDTNIQNNNETIDFSQFKLNDALLKEKFVFIQGMDQIGYDVTNSNHTKDINKNMKICLENDEVVGFNTLGFLKNNILELEPSKYFKQNDGIYIKKSIYEKYQNKEIEKIIDSSNETLTETSNEISTEILTETSEKIIKKVIQIKLLCNWTSSEKLLQEWKPIIKQQLNYQIEFTTSNENIDYFIIINKPQYESDSYDPEKTIVYQMEPWVHNNNKNWGVKTWGIWAKPDKNKFMHVHSHDEYLNNVQWQIEIPETLDIPIKRHDKLISILSEKYFDDGHKKRVNFIRYLEANENELIHIFGKENYHQLNYYQSKLKENKKENHYINYKYCFSVENNSEYNYASEKIWEPILCECLPFYWGCPNLEEYIDHMAFVRLDLNNMEESLSIIKKAIEEDWWSQRIDIIRKEKERIINELGFLPVLHNIINEQPLYNKYKVETFSKNIDKIITKKENNQNVLQELLSYFHFIPQKDIIGNDLYFKQVNNIYDLLEGALLDEKCKAVNTLGFYKNKIDNLSDSPYIPQNGGIFIKK